MTGSPVGGGRSSQTWVSGAVSVGSGARGESPLRIAYVLGTASGGTARHAGLLAEGCRQAGLTVLALGPASSHAAFAIGAASLPAASRRAGNSGGAADPAGARAAREPGGGGIAYYPVEIGDRPAPRRDAVAVAALRRLLRQAGADVVHAHGLRAGALSALAMLAWRPAAGPPGHGPGPAGRRPKLVVTVHNAPPSGRTAAVVYAVLARVCARRADVVLCASADLAARMRRYRARAQEFAVPAPPAPPPSAADIARARADLGPPDGPVVLAVARLAEQKGLDTLLAAAARWRSRSPVPVLAIAGEGPLAGRLTAVAAATGVDLTLLGRRDDVAALLAAADVVVVPSRWEARSLVVQEALRAARPLVASRVGGIPELTGEDAAILVPPGDAGQLGDAVLALLDDPDRAAGLAAAAGRRGAALPGPADAVAAALAVYQSASGSGASGFVPGG